MNPPGGVELFFTVVAFMLAMACATVALGYFASLLLLGLVWLAERLSKKRK